MRPDTLEPRKWRAPRWWSLVALVLTAQVLLVLWLEDPKPPNQRKPGPVLAFHLSTNTLPEWLALEDPTLFALPHLQGFSGPAWLGIWRKEPEPRDWTAPARWLPPPVAQLGAEFRNFVAAHAYVPPLHSSLPEPEVSPPELAAVTPIPVRSNLRLGGPLAGRRLLSQPELRSWPATDLLTSSVVQLLVNARGNTISAVLLPPGSGSSEADESALKLAREARFEPLKAGPATARDPAAGLTVGTLVFEWQTLPVAPTNSAATNP